MSVRNVIVVNFTRMGDLIQSGPLMRSLKTSNPQARITAVVFKAFRAVAERLPMVDEVIGFDVDRFVPKLDAQRGNLASAYDDVQRFLQDNRLQSVDLLYNLAHTQQSAVLCALMMPRFARGLVRMNDGQTNTIGKWFDYLFSIMQERTYNPYNLAEIYLRMGESRIASPRLEFRVTHDDRTQAERLLADAGVQPNQRYVVLQPGASSRSRQWPPAFFAELAVLLNKSGLRPVVVGSAEETGLAEQIGYLSQNSVVSLAGQTDVGTLAAIVEGAYRLVSNDTGTIHLAAAVGTATVGLYLGPASAKDTAPYGSGHIIVEADLPCAPCGYHSECSVFSCHRRVGTDSVFRLCMASDREIDGVARTLAGLRVYRTHVDSSGKFSLKKMNEPETGGDALILDFYRSFWDGLLARDGSSAEMPEKPPAVSHPDWPEGVERLREILERAERWLFALLNELKDAPSGNNRITELLRGSELWKNDLRRFTTEVPLLSPISRFILVRLHSVRNSGLNGYIGDMGDIITTFENAVALVSRTALDEPIRRERAALV